MNRLPKDFELVRKLIESTNEGNIEWQATAEEAQYAASFKGKWTVLVDEFNPQDERPYWTFRIQDADGREMLKMTDGEFEPIMQLYELARRSALNVDQAINDILKDLDNEIPF